MSVVEVELQCIQIGLKKTSKEETAKAPEKLDAKKQPFMTTQRMSRRRRITGMRTMGSQKEEKEDQRQPLFTPQTTGDAEMRSYVLLCTCII